ncbi:hypothetical protein RRG08_065974 [Elysia crispata]|uniref:Uncharacterized protein n=1 Tax=Elysia crispata TaxID=231223 RepID=A0AAE1DTN5_9GAST|nr:hypothetical protein RRG08_065974 [Elysia crispata]
MNRKSDRAGYKATARVAQAIFSRFTRYKWLVAYQVGLCGFALAGVADAEYRFINIEVGGYVSRVMEAPSRPLSPTML